MIGTWQHLVYGEFLPNLLGPRTMEVYGINTKKEGRNDNATPQVTAFLISQSSTFVDYTQY